MDRNTQAEMGKSDLGAKEETKSAQGGLDGFVVKRKSRSPEDLFQEKVKAIISVGKSLQTRSRNLPDRNIKCTNS